LPLGAFHFFALVGLLFLLSFCPFDDAKVWRFFELAMDFDVVCAQTASFFDTNQRKRAKCNF